MVFYFTLLTPKLKRQSSDRTASPSPLEHHYSTQTTATTQPTLKLLSAIAPKRWYLSALSLNLLSLSLYSLNLFSLSLICQTYWYQSRSSPIKWNIFIAPFLSLHHRSLAGNRNRNRKSPVIGLSGGPAGGQRQHSHFRFANGSILSVFRCVAASL